MTRAELIAALEAATGPSRELDVQIALAQPDKFFNAGPYYAGADDRIGRIYPDGSTSVPGNAPDGLVPKYTDSIDAALMLVPEGWVLERLSVWPYESYASLYGTHEGKDGKRWHNACDGRTDGTGKTAPIALCIAAMKAQEAANG